MVFKLGSGGSVCTVELAILVTSRPGVVSETSSQQISGLTGSTKKM